MRLLVLLLVSIELTCWTASGHAGDLPKFRLISINSEGELADPSLLFFLVDGINASSWACGTVYRMDDPRREATRAFLFGDGELRFLPIPPDLGLAAASCRMNNRGDVVGRVWSDRRLPRPFVYRAGCMHGLDTGDAPCGAAADINAKGEVVGHIYSSPLRTHAVLWRDGARIELGHLDGKGRSYACAINDRGVVVGVSAQIPWIWSEGEMKPLDKTPQYAKYCVNDINSQGTVVGFGYSTGGKQEALAWTSAGLRVLPSLSADMPGEDVAFAINERGWIVGKSRSADGKKVACLWHEKGICDLNEVIKGDRNDIRLGFARSVGDNGAICGWAKKGDDTVPFILYPVTAES